MEAPQGKFDPVGFGPKSLTSLEQPKPAPRSRAVPHSSPKRKRVRRTSDILKKREEAREKEKDKIERIFDKCVDEWAEKGFEMFHFATFLDQPDVEKILKGKMDDLNEGEEKKIYYRLFSEQHLPEGREKFMLLLWS